MARDDGPETAVDRLAFNLLGEAFRKLSAEFIRTDRAAGIRHLQAIHDEIAAAARHVEMARPDLVREGIVEGATHRVCTVLQSAGAWPRTFS